MSYAIGSFNIRDFNGAKQTEDGKTENRNFERIADIISDEFDIVAIQEVNAPIAIKMLLLKLNQKKDYFHQWEGVFVPPDNFREGDVEGYGFVWNTRRFDLLDIKNARNPQIIKRKIKGVVGQEHFLRNPCFARFTARGKVGGSNFELRLLNVHVRYTKNATRDACCNCSAKEMRVNEFKALLDDILPRCCDKTGQISGNLCMPFYTFMLGDYNLCLDSMDIQNEYLNKMGRKFKTVQELPTSLKTVDGFNIDEANYYASNYDHFSYEVLMEEKLRLANTRVEVIDRYYQSENEKKERLRLYRIQISDHVPIRLEMDLNKRRHYG